MRALPLFVLLVLCCGTTFGQAPIMPDRPDADTQAKLSRAQSSIEIADGELQLDSDLELTESQSVKIKEIVEIHDDWMRMGAKLPPEKRADKNFVNELVAEYHNELQSLGARLTEEVLLPHQKSLLSRKVFLRNLKFSDGDMLKVITKFYPDKIRLDDERKDKLASISESTKNEIAKAKKKFEAELRRIRKKSETETRGLFTDREMEILGNPQH